MPKQSGIELSERNRLKLRRAREAAQWLQGDLADEAGVSMATVSRVETGDINPSLETLQAMAAALGLVVDVKTKVTITRRK